MAEEGKTSVENEAAAKYVATFKKTIIPKLVELGVRKRLFFWREKTSTRRVADADRGTLETRFLPVAVSRGGQDPAIFDVLEQAILRT